jgi:hypothetical protein
LPGAVTGFAAALWLYAIAPLLGLVAASWGALTIVHAFAVAATTVLAMLVTAAGTLLAADWRADIEGRQAWAELELTATELSLPVSAETAWGIDPRYLVAIDNEALGRVFRDHRLAVRATAAQAVTELPRTIAMASSEPVVGLTTQDALAKTACDQGISVAAVSERNLNCQALRAVPRTKRAEAPIVVASHHGAPAARRGGRAAARTLLVANSNVWAGWVPRVECIPMQARPGWDRADIFVLGNSQDDQTPRLPGICPGSDIASSTEPPSCRGPPRIVGHRSHSAVPTEAKLSAKCAVQPPAAGVLPAADPVERDNLGHPVAVCAAELDVIEIYLDQVLRDLLASSTADSEREQA